MLSVRDIMQPDVVKVTTDTTARHLARLLADEQISRVPGTGDLSSTPSHAPTPVFDGRRSAGNLLQPLPGPPDTPFRPIWATSMWSGGARRRRSTGAPREVMSMPESRHQEGRGEQIIAVEA